MISTLRLFEHQEWADSQILDAIQAHAPAKEDEEIRKLLQHILMVQRFFLSLLQGEALDPKALSEGPASFEDLQAAFSAVHEKELAYLKTLQDSDLSRQFQMPLMPELSASAGDILLQVAMHSHGHRAQAATQLRKLGVKPPITDYILWATRRANT